MSEQHQLDNISGNRTKQREPEYDLITTKLGVSFEYDGIADFKRPKKYFEQLVLYARRKGLDEEWMYLPSDTIMIKPQLNSDEEKERDIIKIKYIHSHPFEIICLNEEDQSSSSK